MSIKSRIQNITRQILHRLPHVKELTDFKNLYDSNSCYLPGFYSSPIVDVTLLKKFQNQIWEKEFPINIAGIQLNDDIQIKYVKEITKFYQLSSFPEFQNKGKRYWYENIFYSYTDAIFLSCLIQYVKPSQIIEVGSGFSSAVMLYTLDEMENSKTSLFFIEPYTERLESILRPNDKEKVTIIRMDVQQVGVEIFKDLKHDDILFIDS